jgi:hypothetical protein
VRSELRIKRRLISPEMYYILSTFTYHQQSCRESRNCNVVDVEKTFETGAARLGYGDVSVKSEVGHQRAKSRGHRAIRLGLCRSEYEECPNRSFAFSRVFGDAGIRVDTIVWLDSNQLPLQAPRLSPMNIMSTYAR